MKGEMRIGTGVLMPGMEELSYKWRHLCCFTARQIKNIGGSLDSIEGFEDLKDEDQQVLKKMLRGELVGDATIIGRGAEATGASPAAPTKKKGVASPPPVETRKRPRAAAVLKDDDVSDATDDYETQIVIQDEKPPLCPYGASCFRKNPEHFKAYRHSGRDDNDDDDDDGSDKKHGDVSTRAVVVVAKKVETAKAVPSPTPQLPPTAATPLPAGSKAKCPHGVMCFRKDPKHFADFEHSSPGTSTLQQNPE